MLYNFWLRNFLNKGAGRYLNKCVVWISKKKVWEEVAGNSWSTLPKAGLRRQATVFLILFFKPCYSCLAQ